MNKVQSITRLKAMGLNRHNTVISANPDEIAFVANEWQRFTIRTDCNRSLSDMPFFMQKEPLDKTGPAALKEFLKNGKREELTFIITDGIKYDDIQIYNGVARLSPNADFSLEISTAKVPLRKMYGYPMFNIIGNIGERLRGCEMVGEIQVAPKDLLRDMLALYELGIFNKYIEFTKYPVPVGESLSPYVFWEIR